MRARSLRLLTLTLLAAFPLPALAAPLGFDAIQRALDAVHVVQEVALSPDGRQLAYVDDVVHVAPVTSLRFTRVSSCTACGESGVAWSPDGTKVAFVQTGADGQGNIAFADVVHGGVRVLTRAHGPLATPRWSPDGTQIAFLYSVGAPKTPSPLLPATPDAGVVGARVYPQRLAIVPVAGGPIRLVGPADLNVYEFDWSPDGRRFAITAAHGNGDANWWIAALATLEARSGTVRTLARPATQLASPRFSGDGTRIATICGIMSDESITGGDICITPANGGATVDVTPEWRASAQTITWNGSATSLIVTAFAAGETLVARATATPGIPRTLWHGTQTVFADSLDGIAPGVTGVSLMRGGALSAIVRQSFTQAPEIALGPIGRWRTITAFNAGVPRLTGAAHNLRWSNDGFSVQGWIVDPPGVAPNAPAPLVTVVHGGPAFANYAVYPSSAPFANFLGTLTARGFRVFAPNPRGSYGQGEAFTRANVKDFGGGDLRDILTGLDAVAQRAPVDPRKVGIFGWSYGGFMTMWAITHTDRFKAAVAGAGLSDWLSYYGTNDIDTWMTPYFGASVYDDPDTYAKASPITFIKQVHTPTLLLAGDRDAEVPFTQSYEYYHALRELHVPAQFVVYPGEGHLMLKRPDQVDVARRLTGWFSRWLR
jgi:dipeptidyl aminopeptidase/acylaminoacyl peptidase